MNIEQLCAEAEKYGHGAITKSEFVAAVYAYSSDLIAVKPIVNGSLPHDAAEIISFLQWMFKKVDKGDEPNESMRMLLMNRSKIDAIQLGGNDRQR